VADELSNSWDNGSPSGGNYWADFQGISPYVISEHNKDNYPLTSRFDISSVPLQLPEWTPTPTPESSALPVSIDTQPAENASVAPEVMDYRKFRS